jgi:hypothetical protein
VGGAIVLAMGAVVAFQLHPYVERTSPGVSYDSFYYVWRTRLVEAEGLEPFRSLPPVIRPNLDRPGFPIVAPLVSAFGIDAYTFMILVRGVAAVAIGAAAGAVSIGLLRQPMWGLAILVIALGTSAAVTGTAIGSLENLLADGPLMAAAATVPLVLHGRASPAALMALLAGAVLLHWVVALLFAALVLGTLATIAIVGALARTEHSQSPVRYGSVVVGVLAGLAIGAMLLPALPRAVPPLTTSLGSLGNVHRFGLYEIPVLVPLALVGAALALSRADPAGRSAIVLFIVWAASIPVAVAASWILPETLKLFRIAAFGLGIPALIGVGLVMLIRIGTDRWRTLGAAGATLLAAVVATVAAASQSGPFNDAAASQLAARYEQARNASAYLTAAGIERPVVFLVRRRPWMFDRVFRAAMPSTLISRMHVYVGELDDLLEAGPLSDPSRPRLAELSSTWWDLAWPEPHAVIDSDPVVIGVDDPSSSDAASLPIGTRLTVLRGPPPSAVLAPPDPIDVSWARAMTWTLIVLLLLGAVGYGWSRALIDASRSVAIALSPAWGVAVLSLVGVVAARLGVPMRGWTAGAAVLLASAAGLGLMAARSARPSRPGHASRTGVR